MPEPLTIAALAVGGLTMVSGGIIENVTDKAFNAVLSGFSTRVRGLRGVSENYDVARAVRAAQIQALERVVRDYFAVGRPEWLAEPHTKPELFRKKALDFCSHTIGRCRQPSIKINLDVSEILLADINRILAKPEQDGPADDRAAQVAKLAEDAVLDELRDELGDVQLPPDFDEHFRIGGGDKPRFLDTFAAFITEEIKNNGQFQKVFTASLLAKIEAITFDTHELIERLERKFARVLAEVQETVKEMHTEVVQTREVAEQMLAIAEETLRQVSAAQSVPLEVLRSILRDMDEDPQDLDATGIERLLLKKAASYKSLVQELKQLSGNQPEVTRLRKSAADALEAGRFADADSELAQAETVDLTSLEELESHADKVRLSAAATRAERGEVAMLRGNISAYGEAAKHFEQAANIARAADNAVSNTYELKEKEARSLQNTQRLKALTAMRNRRRAANID